VVIVLMILFLEKHKVANEKPWPKEVQNVLILKFY